MNSIWCFLVSPFVSPMKLNLNETEKKLVPDTGCDPHCCRGNTSPWSKTGLCRLFCVCVCGGGDIFGREKGEGSSIFFPLQQYIKLHTIEETLHLIVHWSTDIINNWKNGEKGGEAKCWPYMIKRSTDLGWYATQSHTLKTSGEKRRAGLICMTLIVDHFKSRLQWVHQRVHQWS